MNKIIKKISVVVIGISIILTLNGCNTSDKTSGATSEPMFHVLEEAYYYKIAYHDKTKVIYAISDGAYNRGNFTMLVNPDGTPMIYEGN